MRRFRPFTAAAGKASVRPNCDIGRASSGCPLPDPTADLWTLTQKARHATCSLRDMWREVRQSSRTALAVLPRM
jgi:hypothetical protein